MLRQTVSESESCYYFVLCLLLVYLAKCRCLAKKNPNYIGHNNLHNAQRISYVSLVV